MNIRPCIERRHTRAAYIVVSCIALLFVSDFVSGAEITAARLVGCLSETTESVMVWDYVELTRDDSCMRVVARKKLEKLGTVPEGDDPGNIKYVVLRHVKAAGPMLQVKGGSDFVVPAGADRVNFNTRAIWQTRDPLTGLHKAIETDTEIPGRIGRASFRGMPMFQFRIQVVLNEIGSMRILEDRFVALPDDRMVFVTESRDEMEHMLGEFVDPSPDSSAFITEMKRLEGFDVAMTAPLCVMRMPRREGVGGLDEVAFCLTLPSVDVPRVEVRAPAGDLPKVDRFLTGLFPREVPKWQIIENPTDAVIRFPFGDCADPVSNLATRLGILFGNKRPAELANESSEN